MSTRFTILGSGSSGGVPRIGNEWGACDPSEPKNRRLRSSFLIEKFKDEPKNQGEGCTRLLIDTSPDIRQQLLNANIATVDAVAYTHSHADHIHGIDDLRVVYFNLKKRLPVYYDKKTGEDLHIKFGYCFVAPEDKNYVPILEGHELKLEEPLVIDGAGGRIEAVPFTQYHGNAHSLGFRVGDLCYCTDVSSFPDRAFKYLENLDVLILDALRDAPHPCHLTVSQALEVIEEYKPKRAILTHLHVDLDYQELKARLPEHVEPAYDGMVIEL